MKVNYVGKRKEIYELGDVLEGEVVRPINSQQLYIVGDKTADHPLFREATDKELLDEVCNPQNIDFDCQWDAVLCVTRIDDGSWCFMPNDTKVEIMNCYLNVEGE